MDVELKSHQKEEVINLSSTEDDDLSPHLTQSDEAKKEKKRSESESGIRRLIKHINKHKRNVHPIDDILPPQLIVRNGRFEIFDPEDTHRKINQEGAGHISKKGNRTSKQNNGCFSSMRLKIGLMKFKYGDLVPILRTHIKKIEGEFGSGVAAVFRFTRWAILLNTLLSVLWVGLLVVPAAIGFNYKSLDQHTFSAENIFDGKGKLQYTWMFYGSYPSKSLGYRIDFAYIILGILTFFGSLLIILKSTVETNTDSDRNPYSKLLLATWDFSVTGKEAKESVERGITAMAKDMLSESDAIFKAKSRSKTTKCSIFVRRAIAWIISFLLTAGACTTIYYFLIKVSVAEFVINSTNVQVGKTFLEVYGFSLVFALLNSILPFIIELLPKMEAYEKGMHVVYVNVIRIFLLRLLNIFAMIFTLYDTVTSSSFRGCGGTFIGQEFYKIILLDMAVATILQVATKFSMYLIRRRRKKEPMVSKIVLQIVYRQALVWAGTFFCPVIPFLGILAQLLVFAVNYLIISITCKTPLKRFKKAEGIIFFKSCLIVILACLLIPITTIFASQYISIGTSTIEYSNGTVVKQECGPFGKKAPMDVFEEGKNSLPGWLSTIANWVTSSAVFPTILVMGIIIYIQHLRLRMERKKLKQLRVDFFEFQKRCGFKHLKSGRIEDSREEDTVN